MSTMFWLVAFLSSETEITEQAALHGTVHDIGLWISCI